MGHIVGHGIAVVLAPRNCGIVWHDTYLNCHGWLIY